MPFSTIYTQHTDFIFGPNLVPLPKSLNTKLEIFHSIFSSQKLQISFFELLLYTDIQTNVQMQIITFTGLSPNPEYLPIPKNSTIMIRHADKLRTFLMYLHV